MIRKQALLFLAGILGLGVLTACSLLAPESSFAPVHPQELGAGRPTCSTCHGTEEAKGGKLAYAAYDHGADFVKNHKHLANQNAGTCASCHAQSFCSDCHTGKAPLSPAVKLGDRPDRQSPHRGSYLALHRMEGKLDPSSCYKCHGRANNDKCRACHR